MNKRYNRKSTNITISLFYEQYQLNKYNIDPPYQRDKNIWDEKQKSFLLDTILKNFPIPPVFVEQKIDTSTGKTTYDVIDGKQRLTTIVDFIEGKIKLPDTFGNDDYGYAILNGKTFDEIKQLQENDEICKEYISVFWSYVLTIEYIENPDSKVVDSIFDRLNREGARLNAQELRKANYYDTIIFNDLYKLRNEDFFANILQTLNKNRLQDVSFITEIYMLAYYNEIFDGVEEKIDEKFEEMVSLIDEDKSNEIVEKIHNLEDIVTQFDLDYKGYSISGVSHLYAIFWLANYIYNHDIQINNDFSKKLKKFYEDLRGDRNLLQTQIYHASMQSASKYKSSRKKRVLALLDYFGLDSSDIQ